MVTPEDRERPTETGGTTGLADSRDGLDGIEDGDGPLKRQPVGTRLATPEATASTLAGGG
ncbi:hypothetical protein [Salinirubrum litoreum]|uniref:Uncharacterized protein n=1 Tax=Salinirubrum litoreum TaxID=1126234 RepID=A0ABD5RGP7_9EURY|nr:hypothetical protein [Salinirubrum litoreum]